MRIDALVKYQTVAYKQAEAGDEAAAAALTLSFVARRPSEVMKLRAQDLDEGGAVLVIDVSMAEDSLKADDSAGGIRLDAPGLERLQAILRRCAKGKLPLALLFEMPSYSTLVRKVHELCARRRPSGLPLQLPRAGGYHLAQAGAHSR